MGGKGERGGGGAGTGSDATHRDGWRPWWWGASVSVECFKMHVWALIGAVARHTDPLASLPAALARRPTADSRRPHTAV